MDISANKIPLKIAFLWHMHQPFYKSLKSGEYQMPWVRLHGLKDYYDMVAILDRFPLIHQTFNLVPSLIEQIKDYALNNAYDRHLVLTEMPVRELSQEEKEEVLSTFFIGNLKTMIVPYGRFYQLWEKRGKSHKDLSFVRPKFTDQDFLDLQVWSNLSWFDPIFKNDKEILYLFKKGENFTEEDKKLLIFKEREILKSILPKYKELKQKGQIEVSFSPYFHPIMPLIYDIKSARASSPNVVLPQKEFSHPEDVEAQIQLGTSLYQKVFEDEPKGIWPSEGSVSEQIIPILTKFGLVWAASDEEILKLSLLDSDRSEERSTVTVQKKSKLSGHNWLYRPYKLKVGEKQINFIFRDHSLSDLIGFVYGSWNSEDAVFDFIKNLHYIRENIPEKDLPQSLVSIILDGENCWEYYKNDGHDFLDLLYSKISEDPLLKTVTVSEFLNENPPTETLTRLFPGSWINHNFGIWIGHPEDNQAWDLLSLTRENLEEHQRKNKDIDPEKLFLAWKEIYIAEGSDWCWWYGDEHQGPSNEEFDRIFRSHLINVYELLSLEPPEVLLSPVRSGLTPSLIVEPTGYITPILDGRETHFFEWQNAGHYDCLKSGGVMHRASKEIRALFFGFDQDNLYFRIDLDSPKEKYLREYYQFEIEILEPPRYKFVISKDDSILFRFNPDKDEWIEIERNFRIGAQRIIEIALPIKFLDFKKIPKVWFRVMVMKNQEKIETCPEVDLIKFSLPLDKKRPIFWGV
jgi:alpha-amylase/alpha-mannosidase (GH57 family)